MKPALYIQNPVEGVGRILAIGDVHGCANTLKDLLDLAELTSDDIIIFLGDLIDRGPHSKEVLDIVIDLKKHHTTHVVMGNHEELMMTSRNGQENVQWPEIESLWKYHGGTRTLISFGVESAKDVPEMYVELIGEFVRYVETPTHAFVHAGYVHDQSFNELDDDALRWSRIDVGYPPHKSGKKVIAGHTPQRNGHKNEPSLALIDTGCFRDVGHYARLTAMDVLNEKFIVANKNMKDVIPKEVCRIP